MLDVSYLRGWSDPRRSYEQNHQAIHPETSTPETQRQNIKNVSNSKHSIISNLTAEPYKKTTLRMRNCLLLLALSLGGDLP